MPIRPNPQAARLYTTVVEHFVRTGRPLTLASLQKKTGIPLPEIISLFGVRTPELEEVNAEPTANGWDYTPTARAVREEFLRIYRPAPRKNPARER